MHVSPNILMKRDSLRQSNDDRLSSDALFDNIVFLFHI